MIRCSTLPLFLLACLALVPDLAQAQVNIEVIADQTGKDGFTLLVGQNFSYSQGNADSVATSNQVSAFYATYDEPESERVAAWLRQRILINGQYRRTDWNGDTVVNAAFGHLRWTAMWWQRLGTEAFAQYEFNELILLERRTLAGVGLRWDAINGRFIHVYGGTGYLLEDERRNIEPGVGEPVFMTNHRSSSYLSVRLMLDDRIQLVSTTYLQPRLDDATDIQVLSDSSLLFDITEHLSFTTSFVLEHDTQSPTGAENTDVRLTQGLNFDWSFGRSGG